MRCATSCGGRGCASEENPARELAQTRSVCRWERPDVARRRAGWRRWLQQLTSARGFVFIDETWAKTNMTRLRGWCRRGERLASRVPHGHWKTLTLVAALRHDGIIAACVFDGPINAQSFLADVREVLVPALRPGDVVVLDNLSSHKGDEVRRATRAAGARLTVLPPYSPDPTPLNRSSRSSSNCCARRTPDRSSKPGAQSAMCSRHSPQASARDASPMLDIRQLEPISL